MKILHDTGWEARNTGCRCYYVSERFVDYEAVPEEVQSFIDAEKKAWYGQEFSARVIGNRVYFRRGVDSGD
jgi:hypothetical protein